jgi:hypothetical protein
LVNESKEQLTKSVEVEAALGVGSFENALSPKKSQRQSLPPQHLFKQNRSQCVTKLIRKVETQQP